MNAPIAKLTDDVCPHGVQRFLSCARCIDEERCECSPDDPGACVYCEAITDLEQCSTCGEVAYSWPRCTACGTVDEIYLHDRIRRDLNSPVIY